MNSITATKWVFFLQPLILGAWFPRIPQVQEALDLSAGQLAFALIGMPIGLLSALSFGAKVAEALGTRRLLTVAMLTQCILLPLPAFAVSGPTLFIALTISGLALAMAQLGLNVTASLVEAHADRPIMNGCHGFWSVGVLLGSALGAYSAAINVAPSTSLVIVAAFTSAPLILIARQVTDYSVPAQEHNEAASKRISPTLVFIALFAFGIAMTEGAMADWSAVYLTDTFMASAGLAGAGYTVFALFVAAGRFMGDPLKSRFPVQHLAQAFVITALVGLALIVFGPSVSFAFLGIAMLGLGVSLGFPLAVSAVSVLPGRSSASNVAILTQVTLSGFLVGPPMIGIIADHSSMRGGLAALAPALIAAAFFARQLKARD